MKTGRYSKEEIDKIIDLFKQGCSSREIAEAVDRKRNYVVSALNRRNYHFGENDILTDEEFKEAVNMLENYYSIKLIADKFGIKVDKMKKLLKSKGYNTHMGKSYWRKDKVDTLKQLFLEGKNAKQIAEIMNKSDNSIKQQCYNLFGTCSAKLIRQIIREERGEC